jgi:hypothetical protein
MQTFHKTRTSPRLLRSLCDENTTRGASPHPLLAFTHHCCHLERNHYARGPRHIHCRTPCPKSAFCIAIKKASIATSRTPPSTHPPIGAQFHHKHNNHIPLETLETHVPPFMPIRHPLAPSVDDVSHACTVVMSGYQTQAAAS